MRKYTLLFSIVAHAAIVAAIFVVSLAVTGAIPAPRLGVAFVIASPDVPSVPPPPRPRLDRAVVSPDGVPVEEPQALAAETPSPVVALADPGLVDRLEPGVPGGFGTGAIGIVEPPPPPPTPPVQPLRVGGNIRPPQRIHEVAPQYPALARSVRVSGIVILETVIGEDGTVGDVRVLRSIPLLDQAAIDAVKQWRFSPTLLNDRAVPVVMTVTVNFNLN
jgi:periplasmic protein TonB